MNLFDYFGLGQLAVQICRSKLLYSKVLAGASQ